MALRGIHIQPSRKSAPKNIFPGLDLKSVKPLKRTDSDRSQKLYGKGK